jgi:hypothetical protein
MGAYRTPGWVGAKSGAGDFSEAMDTKEGFKRGGKMHKDDKKVMSKAHDGERPRRATGGGVLSSASSGTPRGKASHY